MATYVYLVPYIFLLEPFDVTITASGISTAGQMYTLTCSVDVPGTPSIQWQYSNGSAVTSGDGITGCSHIQPSTNIPWRRVHLLGNSRDNKCRTNRHVGGHCAE